MNEDSFRHLLSQVQAGTLDIEDAIQKLRHMPYENLGFVRLDHHRALRRGFPEVVMGEGKSPSQLVKIIEALAHEDGPILVTRVTAESAHRVLESLKVSGLEYQETARCLVRRPEEPIPLKGRGTIAVLSGGTGDIPVADEAVVTAELMGNRVERYYDVGVSGLHRLFDVYEHICNAEVLIVVAGMEGALPSVVSGLVTRPVIAVPTSVGYGASLGGLAPLLTMLNSCAAGITVVNIDNGFGAGYAAALMNRSSD